MVKNKRTYEAMVVLEASLDGDAKIKATSEIKEAIAKYEGQVILEKELGKRKLAYDIAKRKEGVYVLFQFSADPSQVAKIKRSLTVHDHVLTYIVLENAEDLSGATFVEKV